MTICCNLAQLKLEVQMEVGNMPSWFLRSQCITAIKLSVFKSLYSSHWYVGRDSPFRTILRNTQYKGCTVYRLYPNSKMPAHIKWRFVMHLYEKNAETLAVCHTVSAEKVHIVSTLRQKKQPSRFWLLLKQSYQGCQLPLRATQSCLSAAHIISWPLFFLRPATCCCTGQMIMIRWYTNNKKR